MSTQIYNDIQVFACGGSGFVNRLKKMLPPERFSIFPCPLPPEESGWQPWLRGRTQPGETPTPTIIIVDLSLKKPEGFLRFTDLINSSGLSAVPLLVVVADNDFEMAERALTAGARHFIMRPLYKRHLAQKLEFLVYASNKLEALANAPDALQVEGHEILTGLPGFELFHDMAAHKLQEALRAGQGAALLLINLDHFRRVKAILGKDVSNELIQRVATTIEGTVGEFVADNKQGAHNCRSLIGHNGEDEFFILIAGIGPSHDIEELARRLLSSVSKPAGAPDPKAYLTARICITMAPADGNNIDALIKNVESLAHHEERQGRDSYRFYTSGLKNTVARRFELEAELSQGMHRGDLKIYYQPEVNLRNGEIFGAEALVRWQHPQLGILAPEAFIAVAEDVGLIAEIGDWVLRQACLQCSEWHRLGFSSMRVSINISPYQFSRVDMCELVKHALSEASLPPEYLTLEVTESLIIEDVEKTLASMLKLKRMGVRLALDDFGTGYSSLSYLHSMSVDYLKIDRAFVKELPDHAGGLAVTEAIARMAKALGLGIIAEGVENQNQLKCLRSLGVDSYQGYYFSEPLPAQEFTNLLADGRWKMAVVGKFLK